MLNLNLKLAARCPPPSPVVRRRSRLLTCLLLLPPLLLTTPITSAAPGDADAPPRTGERQTQESAAARGEARALGPGEIVRRDMRGGESHLYRLTLARGQYVRVVVEQQGVDVVVKISDPDAQVLIEMDSPNGMRGPEVASALAQAAGSYTVEVVADKTQLAGGYELRVEGPREAVAADETRVEAERVFTAAQRRAGDRNPEAQAQAIGQYESALALWRAVGDARGEGYTLGALGQSYKVLGRLPEALDNLSRARSRLRDVQDVPGQAFVLNEAGAAHRDLGDPAAALPLYGEALELRATTGDLWGQAQLHNNIGLLYSRIGRQQKALENYELALPLWRSAGDRGMELNTLNNVALVHANMGYLTEAHERYQEVSRSCSETENCRLEPYVLNSLGMIYDTWAEPQEALARYERASALFGEMNNEAGTRGQAIVRDNIGMVYAGLGDAERALEQFQEALKLRQRLNEPGGEAVTLSNIGYAQSLLGNPQEALRYLNLALPRSRVSQNRAFEAHTLTRAGEAYAAQNDAPKAIENYRQALAIQIEVEDRRGQAITLDLLGRAYALLGDTAAALDSYGKALKNWDDVGDRQGRALSLYGVARVERGRNNLTAARDRIEEAVAIVESLRTKMSGHQLRMTYFAGKQDFYALATDVWMRLHAQHRSAADAEAALFANERARARDLLDLLTEARVGPRKGMPRTADKYRRMGQELTAMTQSWLRLRGLNKRDDAAAVEAKIKALLDEQDRLLHAAGTPVADAADARKSRVLRPSEIQRLLDDDTLLLEYAVAEESVHLWAVTRDAVRAYTLGGLAEIENAAARLRRMLTVYEPPKPGESNQQYLARVRVEAAQYPQAALELSRMVLGPVADQLGERRLVVVADGALQYIPFEALQLPTAADYAPTAANVSGYVPLLARHEVVYQPSASTLALLRDAPPRMATKTVAVLADPVFDSNDARVRGGRQRQSSGPTSPPPSWPRDLSRSLRDVGDLGDGGGPFKLDRLRYTAEEADAIASAAPPGSWMKAVSFRASRATATSHALKQFSVVHFATHGILNDRHPELSGIVLSMVNQKGQPEDGYLRLGDIYNLELPVDLVVLSACRTGIGKQVRGEGLIGLTRGFMNAGSPRVVASLWQVDDRATSELMRRFYRLMLRQKLPAAVALRKAKVEMMKLGEWRHPFYWAGFVLQGDWK